MREPRRCWALLPEVPAEQRGAPIIVRSAVASTFVAALELCRRAVVGLDQRGFRHDHGLAAHGSTWSGP